MNIEHTHAPDVSSFIEWTWRSVLRKITNSWYSFSREQQITLSLWKTQIPYCTPASDELYSMVNTHSWLMNYLGVSSFTLWRKHFASRPAVLEIDEVYFMENTNPWLINSLGVNKFTLLENTHSSLKRVSGSKEVYSEDKTHSPGAYCLLTYKDSYITRQNCNTHSRHSLSVALGAKKRTLSLSLDFTWRTVRSMNLARTVNQLYFVPEMSVTRTLRLPNLVRTIRRTIVHF